MKRKGLLAITGCGDKRFETFGTRDQLPFSATLKDASPVAS